MCYHRSPASSSALWLHFCSGWAVAGGTAALVEVHTKKFYSSVEWKEMSSVSLDLTKKPSPPSPLPHLQQKDHIWAHIEENLPPVCKHRNF